LCGKLLSLPKVKFSSSDSKNIVTNSLRYTQAKKRSGLQLSEMMQLQYLGQSISFAQKDPRKSESSALVQLDSKVCQK
jgi:hypothetical protein